MVSDVSVEHRTSIFRVEVNHFCNHGSWIYVFLYFYLMIVVLPYDTKEITKIHVGFDVLWAVCQKMAFLWI